MEEETILFDAFVHFIDARFSEEERRVGGWKERKT
jgi:hypothetical protein